MKKNWERVSRGYGFSLIELLIVISIIAILGAITISTLAVNHP